MIVVERIDTSADFDDSDDFWGSWHARTPMQSTSAPRQGTKMNGFGFINILGPSERNTYHVSIGPSFPTKDHDILYKNIIFFSQEMCQIC